MSESVMIVLLLSSVFCWMAGGAGWPPFRKGWRRFVWPVIASLLLLFSGIVWWKAFLVGGGLMIVNTLPYGDRTPWLWRPVVFASYALPAGALSWQTLLVSLPLSVIVLTLLFVLSRKINWVTWKIYESFAGLLQASSLIMACLSRL